MDYREINDYELLYMISDNDYSFEILLDKYKPFIEKKLRRYANCFKKYGVDIEDLHVDNILYNGKFFIGDPGSFEFKKDSPVGRIYRDNIYSLNRFVINEVFGLVDISKPRKKLLNEMFDDYYYIGEQIRCDSKPRDTVSAYVKRMTK